MMVIVGKYGEEEGGWCTMESKDGYGVVEDHQEWVGHY